MTAVLGAIDQVALTVDDVDAAEVFYEQTLGLTKIFRPQPTMVFFQSGELSILLEKSHDSDMQPGGHEPVPHEMRESLRIKASRCQQDRAEKKSCEHHNPYRLRIGPWIWYMQQTENYAGRYQRPTPPDRLLQHREQVAAEK